MTNREYLNTLKDEERKMRELYKFEELMTYYSPLSNEGVISTFKLFLEWLSQPHETTADEDFAEIGFQKIQEKNENQIRYFSDEFEVIVYKDETKIRIMPSPHSTYVLLENNLIRTIANKKRKELGW